MHTSFHSFPSYTETFGQVVLEALASGTPVIGLDAEGTRDLVIHECTGFLLSPPTSSGPWNAVFRDEKSLIYNEAVLQYTKMLKSLVISPVALAGMKNRVLEEGTQGRTWHDAMEGMGDHYREAIQISESRKDIQEGEEQPKPLVNLFCPVGGRRGITILICIVITLGVLVLILLILIGFHTPCHAFWI